MTSATQPKRRARARPGRVGALRLTRWQDAMLWGNQPGPRRMQLRKSTTCTLKRSSYAPGSRSRPRRPPTLLTPYARFSHISIAKNMTAVCHVAAVFLSALLNITQKTRRTAPQNYFTITGRRSTATILRSTRRSARLRPPLMRKLHWTGSLCISSALRR